MRWHGQFSVVATVVLAAALSPVVAAPSVPDPDSTTAFHEDFAPAGADDVSARIATAAPRRLSTLAGTDGAAWSDARSMHRIKWQKPVPPAGAPAGATANASPAKAPR